VALADRSQFPGPSSGTSTDSNPGSRVPESSPLMAFAFEIGATGFTLEVVALEKLLTTDHVVAVVFAATTTGVVGVVVLIDVLIDVVVTGAWVVTGDVEEGGGDEATGTRGGVAVRVKTRTSSKIGLDHISRWALFREKGARVMVFEG
jgi:hypothetical protein